MRRVSGSGAGFQGSDQLAHGWLTTHRHSPVPRCPESHGNRPAISSYSNGGPSPSLHTYSLGRGPPYWTPNPREWPHYETVETARHLILGRDEITMLQH